MDVAALVLWIVTALGGFAMAAIWLGGGGPAQRRDGASRISPARLGAHAGLAAAGLALWIAYVATDEDAVGWVAFALLPAVALIGLFMFVTWVAGRGATETDPPPAEQRIPAAVVAAHGVAAVATVVAVLVAVVS